ncbi:MAG TPA: SIMPL domain-containing protein [Candidatus Limnocylindrales bacterium]|nr:SIMPL domain-containing protein [Candidatus Limnocylindrales bacterium]
MSTKNIILTSVVVLVAVLVVAGCGGPQLNTGTVESPKIIQAYGEAEIKSAPDLAKISLAVETRYPTAVNAVEENARLASAVREALLAFGLAEEDIVTGSYQLYSYREWFEGQPAGEEEPQAFHAINEIIVTTVKLDSVGEIIDTAVSAGANNINYISFEIDNPQELLLQALKKAAEQATMKAEAIADGSGENITGLHSIREERADYIPYRFQDEMLEEKMGMGGAATPIAPGQVTVRAAVVAEFSF